MLKMYHSQAHTGESPQFWEENWENHPMDEQDRFCERDPLGPLFERFAMPGMAMLEGGCGHGQYVAYYSGRGVKVVGLDFAQGTLSRIRAENAMLMLCSGDVAALPFRDESFDVYYSGGVVEHFEGGAESALLEARRVLRHNGILLVSVPYVNLLRRLFAPFFPTWRSIAHAEVDNQEFVEGAQFFQYAYTRREFEKMLTAAGLRVIGTQGYGIVWGLYDYHSIQTFIERVRLIIGRYSQNASPPARPQAPHRTTSTVSVMGESRPHAARKTGKAPPGYRSIIKRVAVNEDDQIPVLGLGVRLMRLVSANMMMYVCVKC